MEHYAIRDPRNGKYVKKGASSTRGRHDEPHFLFYEASGAKSSITQKKKYGWGDSEEVEYEIVPVTTTVDEENIETYG